MVLRVAAALASVALLAGCTAPPTLPTGLDPADVKQLVAERDAVWWSSMFPAEPQPSIDAVRVVSPKEQAGVTKACILNAGLPTNSVTYEGQIVFDAGDPAAAEAYNRQAFTCAMQYPVDLSDPAALGYLSVGQLRYQYDYYRTRLVPCLESLGFHFQTPPSQVTYVQGGPNYWLPYYDLRPVPTTGAQWSLIDLRCPPPPYLADARPRLVP